MTEIIRDKIVQETLLELGIEQLKFIIKSVSKKDKKKIKKIIPKYINFKYKDASYEIAFGNRMIFNNKKIIENNCLIYNVIDKKDIIKIITIGEFVECEDKSSQFFKNIDRCKVYLVDDDIRYIKSLKINIPKEHKITSFFNREPFAVCFLSLILPGVVPLCYYLGMLKY